MEKRDAIKRIELIETFFQKAKSDDEHGELAYIRRKYGVIRTEGLDVQKMMRLGGSELVVNTLKRFVAQTQDDNEVIVFKGTCGLPLTIDDKVQLVKYQYALQWLCAFWR